MPIFILLIVAFCLCVFFLLVLPLLPFATRMHSAIQVSVITAVFLWSYYSASFSDPGFLPFDWARSRLFRYGWLDQLSGLAIRRDQFEFAREHRPTFASFSRSAGRFVIRADHMCCWIGNWVGKRNHKQFILMAFWGGVLATLLFVWNVIAAIELEDLVFWNILIVLFAIGTEVVFSIALFFVFVSNLNDLRKNVTTIQRWKQERGQSYGCMKSMREVCGNGSVWCWALPIPAFGDDLFIADDEFPPAPDEAVV
jgi:hypothetical protein